MISENITYTFADRDEFQRQPIAEKLIKLLDSEIDISPVVIDGAWGSGKTEFCLKTISLMKENDTSQPIYINAFFADHADEPLLTILAEVLKLVPHAKEKEILKKVIPAVRFGLKTIAKATVSHLLRQDTDSVLEGLDEEIQSAADTAIDSTVEALLKDHIKANESLEALQKVLKELAETKPIVIFVDELDRCRPNFAVSLLEVIKHVFDVKGVKFVLVTNTQQLKASINHCYGQAVDAQRYLDKFLKYSMVLPNTFSLTASHELKKAAVSHCENLLSKSPALSTTGLHKDYPFKFITDIISSNNLSLREVETLVRHLEIYHTLMDNQGFASNHFEGYKVIRILGVALFTLFPETSAEFLDGHSDAIKLGQVFLTNELPVWDGNYPYPELYHFFMYAIGRECQINSDKFTPQTPELKNAWEIGFNNFFKNGFPPYSDERLNILLQSIRTMSLSKNQ